MTARMAFDKPVTLAGSSPITFATELWLADGDRGTDLLKPQAPVRVRDHVDVHHKRGGQGVTVAIRYPAEANSIA